MERTDQPEAVGSMAIEKCINEYDVDDVVRRLDRARVVRGARSKIDIVKISGAGKP